MPPGPGGLLHPAVGSNTVSDRSSRYADPEAAFAAAAHHIAITTRYPRNAGTPLETFVVLAEHLPGEDIYEVTANFQGGLATALAEACLAGGLGATVRLPGGDSVDAALFGEGPGGFAVSGPADAIERLGERLPVSVLGEVGGDRLAVDGALDLSLADLRRAHAALSQLFP